MACFQYDSFAIWARTMSSSMPHLHAAHWMISSVVPVKLPVIRGLSTSGCAPVVWLAVALDGRISEVGRTAAVHCASVGSDAPTGRVAKCPGVG